MDPRLRPRHWPCGRGGHVVDYATHAEEHQGHVGNATPATRDAPLASRVQRRSSKNERSNDEDVSGTQGEPDGIVLADCGSNAGVHHHVPGVKRFDFESSRRSDVCTEVLEQNFGAL